MNTHIITHRGLEEGSQGEFGESTLEAFKKQLNQGFSLEFDPNLTQDSIVVWHDKALTRLTGGNDDRPLKDISTQDFINLKWANGSLCTLKDLLEEIKKSSSPANAMHIKHTLQDKDSLDRLLEVVTPMNNLFLFDLKVEVAQYIKSVQPNLSLGITVAHPYDIERYNECVGGTLYSIEEALQHKDLFDWAWLDEWDRRGANGRSKTLYNRKTFNALRAKDFKIALVTPEIHGTSPGLLGGEAHEDAEPKEQLFSRIEEIVALEPDAVCTDWQNVLKKSLTTA